MSESPSELGHTVTVATAELAATVASTGGEGQEPTQAARGLLIGRYVVISTLGAGAMGVVFAAFDPELDRKVALKLLKHRGGELGRARKRLQREAQSLAKLDHPNVVSVFDVGVHQEQLFVAMEFVEGQTLGEWMGAVEEPRPWPEVLEVFMAAGRGLAAAHEVGMVHRDFKPDNVMLGADGRVRVMDFGLARGETDTEGEAEAVKDSLMEVRQAVGKLTQTGAMVGTPAYMSFEQFGGEVDARSDQFGFCVALYEALYGQRPFAGQTLNELMRALWDETIRPAPQGARVPGWLRQVIVRGLAREPDARFESMAALLDALAADPVARRRSWLARGGLALALAGSVWGLGWLWTQVAARDEVIADKEQELRRQNEQLREEKLAAEAARDRAEIASMMASARELAARRQFDLAAALLVSVDEPQTVRGWTELALEVLSHPIPTLTLRHADAVTYAEWSPDGQRLVTASDDNTARVWNADGSGDPIILDGHTGGVAHAVWSPDGQRILTASEDHTARVWRADGSGEPIVLEGHEGPLSHAEWSPDGQRILTSSWDASARVWRADGEGEAIVLDGHTDWISHAAWSPDGQRILTASRDATAQIWNADGSGEPIVLEGHALGVLRGAWSADGHRVITSSFDSTARIWRADGSGDPIVLDAHRGYVTHTAWSPDGQRILTASGDGTARLWNADGAGELEVLDEHTGRVYHAEWSPDGLYILTASEDHTARIWRADGPARPVFLDGAATIFGAHADSVMHAAWSPDGQRILTASEDHTARVWRVADSASFVDLEGHRGSVMHAAWSPDGLHVLTASLDQTARIWRSDGSGDPVVLEGHADFLLYASWSPDGRDVVTASRDDTARVWHADGSGDPVVLDGHTDDVELAVWSPDGRHILTASNDQTARVWRADGSGDPVVLGGHTDSVVHAAWSPDGQRILTASDDQTVRVQRADGSGDSVVFEGHSSSIPHAAWSPDGQRIVTVSNDQTARVWRADGSGEPIILEGHADWVVDAMWSPDGQHIVTASKDRTARVWNVDGSGDPSVLAGHTDALESAAWSPDGQHILTTAWDRTIRVWNADGSGDPVVLDDQPGYVSLAVWSPDGQRILIASTNGTACIWGIAPPYLEAALRESSSTCLTPEQRQSYLGEVRAEALAGYEQCERDQGRDSFGGTLRVTMRRVTLTPSAPASVASTAAEDSAAAVCAHVIDVLLATEAGDDTRSLIELRAACNTSLGQIEARSVCLREGTPDACEDAPDSDRPWLPDPGAELPAPAPLPSERARARYDALSTCLLAAGTVAALDTCEGPSWRAGPSLRGRAELPTTATSEQRCERALAVLKAEARGRDVTLPRDELDEPRSRCIAQTDPDLAALRREVEPLTRAGELHVQLSDVLQGRAMIHDVGRCYRAALLGEASLEGELVLAFTVEATSEARVELHSASLDTERTQLADPALGACVARALDRRELSDLDLRPEDGALAATVTYDLDWI